MQCWSPALLICWEFKPIAAGGMVPLDRLPTPCKARGLRKYKIPAIDWWSHSTRHLEVHLQRGGYMLAVLISSSADVLTLEAYYRWLNGSTRKTTHFMQRWRPQEAYSASSLLVELFHQALEVHLQRGGIYSVDLQFCLMSWDLKFIAVGGMVLPESVPTARKVGGLRKHKMPCSSSLVEPFHQVQEVHAPSKRRIHAGMQCWSPALLICLETSSLLPQRYSLLSWKTKFRHGLLQSQIIPNYCFGFWKGHRTLDAIFVLNNLLQKTKWNTIGSSAISLISGKL